MSGRETPGERGRRRGTRLLRELIEEGREARLGAGITQAAVGRTIGLSKARVSAIERGDHPDVPFVVVAQLLAAVGLQLAARAYPVEGGLRDEGQLRLIARLRPFVNAVVRWRTEVAIGGAGDLRAWDVELTAGACRIGVDAEVRLRDVQAVDRKIMLKARDSNVDRVLLLVADTRWNRDVLRALPTAARGNFPTSARTALRHLARGEDPGGNAIIVL